VRSRSEDVAVARRLKSKKLTIDEEEEDRT